MSDETRDFAEPVESEAEAAAAEAVAGENGIETQPVATDTPAMPVAAGGQQADQAAPAAADESPVPDMPDAGQNVSDVSNEETPVNEQAAEPIAEDAPESPPVVAEAATDVEPSEATAAASEPLAEANQTEPIEPEILQTDQDPLGEAIQLGPATLEPCVYASGDDVATEAPVNISFTGALPDALTRVAELECQLEEKKKLTVELFDSNDILSRQLSEAAISLERTRAEFAQAMDASRADVVALMEELATEIGRFLDRARAIRTTLPAERVRVSLRLPAIVAGEAKEIGETLGFVALAPGVTLNFLVDAIRNGIARGK